MLTYRILHSNSRHAPLVFACPYIGEGACTSELPLRVANELIKATSSLVPQEKYRLAQQNLDKQKKDLDALEEAEKAKAGKQ